MDEELAVDDHVAQQNGHRVEEPAVHADHQHGGHVQEEVAERHEEGGEGGLLQGAVVDDAHPVALVDAALLAAEVEEDARVAQHHQHQRQDEEARDEKHANSFTSHKQREATMVSRRTSALSTVTPLKAVFRFI